MVETTTIQGICSKDSHMLSDILSNLSRGHTFGGSRLYKSSEQVPRKKSLHQNTHLGFCFVELHEVKSKVEPTQILEGLHGGVFKIKIVLNLFYWCDNDDFH